MNDTELQTAIAVALGYTFQDKDFDFRGTKANIRFWNDPRGQGMRMGWPPNYPQDLNACHQVWLTLTPSQKQAFEDHLYDVVVGDAEYHRNDDAPYITNATAAQRAQALYLTLK